MPKDINIVVTGTCGRGETFWDREITKEMYDRAKENSGILTKEDAETVLTVSERLGYSASARHVYQADGKYFVQCSRYNSCD